MLCLAPSSTSLCKPVFSTRSIVLGETETERAQLLLAQVYKEAEHRRTKDRAI